MKNIKLNLPQVLITLLVLLSSCNSNTESNNNTESDWNNVKKLSTIEDYKEFINKTDDQVYIDSAKAFIHELYEDKIWSEFYDFSRFNDVSTSIFQFIQDIGYIEGEGYKMMSLDLVNFNSTNCYITYSDRIDVDSTLLNNGKWDFVNKPVIINGFLVNKFSDEVQQFLLLKEKKYDCKKMSIYLSYQKR